MIKKRLVVKAGEYEGRDGKTKAKWVGIGALHEGQHGDYITLDRHINLAGFPMKDGDDRVFVNMFEPDNQKRPDTQGGPPAQDGGGIDQDIPFMRLPSSYAL